MKLKFGIRIAVDDDDVQMPSAVHHSDAAAAAAATNGSIYPSIYISQPTARGTHRLRKSTIRTAAVDADSTQRETGEDGKPGPDADRSDPIRSVRDPNRSRTIIVLLRGCPR